MNILIPMAGLGQRFKNENYIFPKPLVKLAGNPILTYLLKSLTIYKSNDDIIYITYVKPLNILSLLQNHFEKINIVDDFNNIQLTLKGSGKGICICIELEIPTQGAAETLYISTKIMKNLPLLSLDCDNFYNENICNKVRNLISSAIFYFEDFQSNPIYSYISKNSNNIVVDIKEKIKISHYACSGGYFFKDTKTANEYSLKILKLSSVQNEIYISSIFEMMIKENHTIQAISAIPINLGTPMAIEIYYKSVKN